MPASFAGADELDQERARLVVICSLGIGLWSPLYTIPLALMGAPLSALVIGGGGAALIATVLVLRLSGSAQVAGHWLAGTFFTMIVCYSTLNKGDNALVGVSLALVPALAMPLTGARGGIIWALLGVFVQVMLTVFHDSLPPSEVSPELMQATVKASAVLLPLLFGGLLFILELLRQAARAQLRGHQEELRAVFDWAVDGILVADERGVVVRANSAAGRLFGLESQSLIGRSFQDLLVGTEDMSTYAGNRMPSEILRPDGEKWPVALSLGVASGDQTRLIAMLHDERQSRAAQEAIRQARDRAQEASRTKSGFLANMSHELRTPLNAIIGYSEMLLDDAKDRQDAEAAADLERVHLAGRHLLGLINDILDLSKIEAGKLELHPEEIDVGALLEDVQATVAPLAKRNRNSLDLQIHGDIGPTRTDAVRLRQVLYNLLSNACKFTEAGHVTLSAREERDEGNQRLLVFEVVDTGIGMSTDQVSRVFDEFVQGDGTTTRKYGGTGLGLSITKRLATMMGGGISCQSAPGRGSTFTVRVAARLDGARSTTPGALTRSATRGGILVIDDDPDARELMSRLLSSAGYRVTTAENGEQGLAMARAQRPRAVVLDIQLPDMDGWSVLAALKGDPEVARIPVVLVTMTEDRAMGLALGAADFFSKPVDKVALLHTLRRVRGPEASGEALVVEDDRDLSELVTRTLTSAGWQVRCAHDGVEALAALESGLPDVVLLDLMMPRMDGFGVLEAMHARSDWREVPVVVMTAKDLDSQDLLRLRGTVANILPKNGIPREALLEEVLDVVAMHATRPPAPERNTGPTAPPREG